MFIIFIIIARYYILPSVLHTDVPIAVVEGKSMFPVLREGDIVFAYKPPPNEIREGDVIIYEHKGRYIIHRVIEVIKQDDRYYYVTKGDNNLFKDMYYVPGVPYEYVKGKVFELDGFVFKIPYIGHFTLWIHSS